MPQANWKRTFFTVWTGQAFSLFGSSLVDFALIWWLTETTQSEQILAVSTLITLVPRMIIGPFAGAVIDRLKRKAVVMGADSAVAVVTLALIVLFRLGLAGTGVIMGALFLRSMGQMFHQPAMMSTTPLIVPEEYLSRAGGMDKILNGMMSIVAPVAGALLIDLFSVEAVLYIDVATAAVAVATFAAAKIRQPSAGPRQGSTVMQETREGFRYVLHSKALFFVVGTCTLTNLFCGPANAMKSLLDTKLFGGGVAELSCITSLSGAGLVAGGVIMGLWGGFRRRLITSALGWAGVGVGYIVTGVLPSDAFPALAAAMFVSNVFMAIGGASLEAFYQSYVPSEYQGRVFSVLNTLDNASVPLGLGGGGILGGRGPGQGGFLLVGIFHFILGIFWPLSKSIRQAEEPAAEKEGE